MKTLILAPRFTEDSRALWRAALRLGWGVERLGSWRLTDELREIAEPVLYLEGLFAPSLAEFLGLRLLEPPLDWLPRLPECYRKRKVSLGTMRQARALEGAAFVKPPNDKSFRATVYTNASLPRDYDDAPVLIAEVVAWEKEFRSFVLDREPLATSVYLRHNEPQSATGYAANADELAEAESFIRGVLADDRVEFPRAGVLDVGVIPRRGWAVVEPNMAWSSGIYGCDPGRVLEVVRHATVAAD
ncbi:ATP-grasp domain-containing protein [Singulisphaera sp. PoT]|uniref:ATP-grasp domain-containing protein n=1 Tax=Singulisphaera sp. PoT TaxID=3411797 RepID=UPI003BF47687